MPYVNSTAIAKIEHNERTHVLSIWFHETGHYDYFNVPRHIYEAFLRAPSKGRFFNDYIKDRYSANR